MAAVLLLSMGVVWVGWQLTRTTAAAWSWSTATGRRRPRRRRGPTIRRRPPVGIWQIVPASPAAEPPRRHLVACPDCIPGRDVVLGRYAGQDAALAVALAHEGRRGHRPEVFVR